MSPQNISNQEQAKLNTLNFPTEESKNLLSMTLPGIKSLDNRNQEDINLDFCSGEIVLSKKLTLKTAGDAI